jgi:hypothetical protein
MYIIRGIRQVLGWDPKFAQKVGFDKRINGWCAVCIGKGVKIMFMACEKTIEMTNELQGLMKDDELKAMENFVPMKKKVY